ncbi:HPF/RaiA family ribosome-associated protein [Vulgatibacter sp.]|uniref:HPF/RaiA family ribosome-associated protein n=1 Tax=Vulgatibacter sp. TaxID=1971226 RepID=UPI0035623AAB
MQFIVHGHHLDLTESLKERCRAHVYDRAEKLVDDTAARLEIELADHFGQKHGKGDKSCRIDLRAPGLSPIHVSEMRPSMHEAIDIAADRLIEALRRGVEKKEDRRRRDDIRNHVPQTPAEAGEEQEEF